MDRARNLASAGAGSLTIFTHSGGSSVWNDLDAWGLDIPAIIPILLRLEAGQPLPQLLVLGA